MIEFHEQITSLLKNPSDREAALRKILGLVLANFKSETGTIHLLDSEKQLLHLAAESGLPPAMLAMIKTIPLGKGIAGEVIAKGTPVTMCNLQTDTTGVSRPGARQSGVGGALCVPLRNGEKIIGTLGIGTIRPYEYTSEETQALEKIGDLIGAQFA